MSIVQAKITVRAEQKFAQISVTLEIGKEKFDKALIPRTTFVALANIDRTVKRFINMMENSRWIEYEMEDLHFVVEYRLNRNRNRLSERSAL